MLDTQDSKFVTLTNQGYLSYTENCLLSLEQCGFNGELFCYCVDEHSHQALTSNGYRSVVFDGCDHIISDFKTYRKDDWEKVVRQKLRIIHHSLLTHKYVIYTDGDITFEDSAFYLRLHDHIGEKELLIQNDSMSDSNHSNLCAGFMMIRSTENTRRLFAAKDLKIHEGWCDQPYINSIKNQLDYAVLPLELFPNGAYYYRHSERLNPYMIHFNWVRGHNKRVKMTEYGKWYVNNE